MTVPSWERGRARVDMEKREGNVTPSTEAEIGLTELQTKKCKEPPLVGKGKEQVHTYNLQRKHDPPDTGLGPKWY